MQGAVYQAARDRLLELPAPGPVPIWTSARIPDSIPLGRLDRGASCVAILEDGRVLVADRAGRVQVLDPTRPGSRPAARDPGDALSGRITAMGALPGGRVVVVDDDATAMVLNMMGRRISVRRAAGFRTSTWALWRPCLGAASLPQATTFGFGIWIDRLRIPSTWAHAALGPAAAVLPAPDGRIVTGSDRLLVWDSDRPGSAPVELGPVEGYVTAVCALPTARIVTLDSDDHVVIWDPAEPSGAPRDLGQLTCREAAMTSTHEGRVVTGGSDGRVWLWDPDSPVVLP